MKKTMTAVGILALGAALTFAAPQDATKNESKRMKGHAGHAMKGEHGGMRGHGRMMARMAEKLNLSEGQKIQMKELHEGFRTQNQPLFEAMKATKQQLREARQAGDTARAQQLAATLEQQRASMKQAREAQHERMLALLTPEQRATMDAMKAERGQHRKGERGHRR